jgi:hypothetical protein
MTAINEKEFATRKASITPEPLGIVGLAGICLAALDCVFRRRYDIDRLPARLRRDAGMDELEIERNRLAKAPLIR